MGSNVDNKTTAATEALEHDGYLLTRSTAEYQRLRAQARAWEPATGRLLDHVDLAVGARCLDVGCGPGETMRLMAQRVGPTGEVTGIDIDATLGTQALDMLHSAGHRQCRFVHADITAPRPIPGAPFDLVYARALLMHLPDPTAVARRLWAAVAPGGHLVIQDFDTRTIDVVPQLETVAEFRRVFIATINAAGRHTNLGHRLPRLFAEAGIGTPDGTDVAGRLEPFSNLASELAGLYRAILPAALTFGVTTRARADQWLNQLAGDSDAHPERAALWPLLIGAWKHKA